MFVILTGDKNFGTVGTTYTWLPTLLKEMGIVKSSSQLKRNRPDLWRDILRQEGGDVVKIGRRHVRVYGVDHIIEIEE